MGAGWEAGRTTFLREEGQQKRDTTRAQPLARANTAHTTILRNITRKPQVHKLAQFYQRAKLDPLPYTA